MIYIYIYPYLCIYIYIHGYMVIWKVIYGECVSQEGECRNVT